MHQTPWVWWAQCTKSISSNSSNTTSSTIEFILFWNGLPLDSRNLLDERAYWLMYFILNLSSWAVSSMKKFITFRHHLPVLEQVLQFCLFTLFCKNYSLVYYNFLRFAILKYLFQLYLFINHKKRSETFFYLGIHANDIGSLLEQFLEYEQGMELYIL